VEQLNRWFRDAYDTALGWLSSPAALSQFGILIAAYILARLLARRFSPAVERTLTPKPEATHILARLRRFALVFLPLLLPLLAYALNAERSSPLASASSCSSPPLNWSAKSCPPAS
jgi:potassium-dependent mechanosensitive channel